MFRLATVVTTLFFSTICFSVQGVTFNDHIVLICYLVFTNCVTSSFLHLAYICECDTKWFSPVITKNIFQGTIVLNPEYSKSKSLKTKKKNPYQSKDITFYHNITYLNGSNEGKIWRRIMIRLIKRRNLSFVIENWGKNVTDIMRCLLNYIEKRAVHGQVFSSQVSNISLW